MEAYQKPLARVTVDSWSIASFLYIIGMNYKDYDSELFVPFFKEELK